MSSVSHTPGPWERRSIPGHLFELHNTKGETVLKVRSGMMPMLSDAKVLAAAPDLLAMCKRLIADLPELWGDLVQDGYIRLQVSADDIEATLTAITKAEGREP
jgi:hypothetical protein